MLPVQEGKFPLHSLGFHLGQRIKLTEARLTEKKMYFHTCVNLKDMRFEDMTKTESFYVF